MAARSLIQIANHFKGTQLLSRPQPKIREAINASARILPTSRDKKARIARSKWRRRCGHNLLMAGPPGAGKSMLAARLRRSAPLSPAELLEVSMIASVAGALEDGALTNRRPFRAPHHSASMPALVGGGLRARPGEVSLAHHGFVPRRISRVLTAGPRLAAANLESGEVAIARANHRVTYPARSC